MDWEQVKGIFQDTFERDPDARASWLDVVCAGDAELRGAVEKLLAAHASAEGFLEDTAAQTAFEVDAPLSRVGPYSIVREIGRGGMGEVYLAERDDPGFRKTVAIKVVRRDSHALLRRFRTETQILSALEHPGIARLYDGGTTDAGLPYFVMEYVAGENIVAYCDAHHLSIADRLQLFRRVCDAVQFAHQSFVVHRDLKPSNILVTADGEPKLLDFGIAKLLNPEAATGSIEQTIEITRLLTPQYASPEQVRGQPVTAASDVYSLGVILYELVAGTRPYRVSSAQSTAEIERAVCDTEPPPPSAAAPPALRRELRGDVDNIARRALRKDLAERYATVAELADDIRRYVAGFPVRAQPDRVAYRARKFVRRHLPGVVAASIAVVSLIVGLGAAMWQARVARRERDHARAEAAKAQRVAGFLSQIFQGADPVRARGKTVTARDLLDRATDSIRTELANDPDVEASLLLVMADAYSKMSLYEKTAELAEQALALRRRIAPHSSAVADALQAAGAVQRRLGRAALGVPLLEEALALRESGGGDDRAVAQTLIDLEIARATVGSVDGSQQLLERAVALLERAAPTSTRLAHAYNVLGAYFYDRRDFEHARGAYERSIAVYERTNEAESTVDVVNPLLNLADVLALQGSVSAAQPLVERAMPISERVFGKESQPVAYELGRLGDLARATGDLPRARALLKRSLAMYAAVMPPDYYETAEVQEFLGRTLMAQRKPDEALPVFERARRIIEQGHGPDHAEVAEVLVDIGRARAAIDGAAAADPLLRRALTIQRRALAPDSEALVPTLTALGETLGREHKSDEARPLLEEAVRIARRRLPERHADRLQAETALAALGARSGS